MRFRFESNMVTSLSLNYDLICGIAATNSILDSDSERAVKA